MRLLDFTIIKLTLCLIVGIICATVFNIPIPVVIYICCGLMMLLITTLIISNNKLQKTIWFGTTAYLTMICIGILVVNFHDQRNFKNHYSKVISIKNEAPKLITFKVREILKPTAYQDKYVVDILKIDDQVVSGKLLLNVQQDSLSKLLQVDDILITHTSL